VCLHDARDEVRRQRWLTAGMTMDTQDCPAHIFRFSTDDLPARERLPYFREEFGRSICKVDVVPLSDEPFHANLNVTQLPDCSLTQINTSLIRFQRTSSLLAADSNDNIHLSISVGGPTKINLLKRDILLPAGGALLGSTNQIGHADQSHHFTIGMSPRRLKALVPGVEDRIAEHIPQETPALRLITGHLQNWQHGEIAITPQMQQTFSDHLYDLIALLFNVKGDAAELAQKRGLRAARLAQIEREISRRALDPDFSLDALARCLGITPRRVQMLLAEQHDASFIKKLTAERLARARHLLGSPAQRHLTITEIAYQCGFSSTEHFYRTFRAHFRMTPGEARARAAVDGLVR
jgi:AraC-like DNA-binding protein